MEYLENRTDSYFYYQVPVIEDKTPKQIYSKNSILNQIIKDYPQFDDCVIENQIRSYLSKMKLNYPITTYTFQQQIQKNDYRGNFNYDISELLDGRISAGQKTYDEFLKKFIPICQQKYGTHQKIDITGHIKSYWISFVRMTILERIIQNILKQSSHKDVFIVLLMEPLEDALFNDLRNDFIKQGTRTKLFYVSTGNFIQKNHMKFAAQLLTNYSTEQPTSKICYYKEQFYNGEYNEHSSLYYYFNEVVNDILLQLVFHDGVDAEQKLFQYPWLEESNKVIRGTFVFSRVDYGDLIPIKHTSGQFLTKIQDLSVDQTIDIFSMWVNQIQIEYNLSNFEKKNIETCIDFLTQYMVDYMNNIDISNVPINTPIENMTVKQRLIAQSSNRCKFKLILLIKSLQNIFTQDTIGDLNQEETLERQKIGTQVGKFHQRALVMRGLDVETFQEMKKFFINELQRVKGSLSYHSDQERSIFSLENMKDVLLQEDIIEALQEMKSQYHLISAFPLIGLGVKLQRSDGSMINPYLVQVTDIARINANVDTVSIQNTPEKELNLNAGFYMGAADGGRQVQEQQYGFKQLKWTQYQPKKSLLHELEKPELFYYKSEQLKERIDAVVPLFGAKDYDLRPLLNTSFFHILMNFNVMHNVDTCFSEAYLALLANTLIFLLNQEQSSYTNELLDKIYHSVNIAYGDRPFFKTYCELLMKQPRSAMVTYHEGHPTQCQDASKALICLFYLVKNGDLTEKTKIKEILEAILQEIVSRGIKNLEKLHTYFGIQGYDNDDFKKIEEDIIQNEIGDVLQYSSVRIMMKKVESALKEKNYFEFTKKCKVFIYKDSFKFMNLGKLNFFTSMKTICNYFLPDEVFNGGLLWIWLLHAQKYPNNYSRNTSEMQTHIQKVYSNIKKQKTVFFIKEESLKIYQSCYEQLKVKYQEQMFLLHLEAVPYSLNQIAQAIIHEDNKFNPKFNNVSNLTKNCCLSPKCPFYLKKMQSLSEHIKDIDCVIPGFHKTVKLMIKREPEAIYNAICTGQFLGGDSVEEQIKQTVRLNSERVQNFLLKKKKECYLKLIEELIVKYRNIWRDEHK